MSKTLNTYAAQEQVLELTQQADTLMPEKKKSKRIEGVSVTYKIKQHFNLNSRNDKQLIGITSINLPARISYVSAPVLTDFVYRQAKMKNRSDYILLPGSYNSYINGEFVGKGKMNLIASGENFNTGFGVEPQLQIKKELTSKFEDIEGGNKVTELEYKITISNYTKKMVPLKLEDRLPYSPTGVVKIKLLSAAPVLSEDKKYRQTSFKKGILRWDLKIPGNSSEKDAITIIYKFRIAHERNKTIKGLSESEKTQIYRELKLKKMRRRR